jgi:hypothetical protein
VSIATLRNESGAALVVALLLLLGLASMGMAAIMISSTDFVVAGNDRARSAALNVAEAGLAEAMHRLGLPAGSMVNVGGATIDASIGDPSDPPDPNWLARIYLTDPGGAPTSNPPLFNTGTLQAPGERLEYSHPTDANRVLTIRHKLRDFDGDGTLEVARYDVSQVPPENPFSGEPIERIMVQGHFGQAERHVQADVIRFPLNPNVLAALQAFGDVDLRGDVTACGHNHSIATPLYTGLPDCSPTWDETGGHQTGVMTSGQPIHTSGSTDLIGSPLPTDTDPSNLFRSCAETLGLTDAEFATIMAGAHYDDARFAAASTWDGIVHLRGDTKIPGGVGRGLLYVEGTLTITGNFAWTGLVYTEGQLVNHGTAWILGACMARGAGDPVAVDIGSGNPMVLYSREALLQALNLAMEYIVLAWKEL